MRSYEQVPPTAPLTPPVTNTVGRYLPTPEADAWTPLTQAVLGGVLVATAVTACLLTVLVWRQSDLLAALPFLLVVWLTVASVLAAVLYFVQLRAVQRTWWDIELIRGVDLDGDGQIGPPAHGMVVRTTPADPAAVMARKTAELLRAIYDRQSTPYRAIRSLCPDLTQAEYEEIRDRLIAAGLAEWIGSGRAHGWRPRAGLALEEALRQAQQRIIWLAQGSNR